MIFFMVFVLSVCPTYVGMNRAHLLAALLAARMPHVCGDEPNCHVAAGGGC